MGQHLHLYASSDVTIAEVQAWASCRADEYFRMPDPGFEENSCKKIYAIMNRRDNEEHLECGSTWCVNIWSNLVWVPWFASDQLIRKCREDLEHFMLDRPALPGSGSQWLEHPIFGLLEKHKGKLIWGENDGI